MQKNTSYLSFQKMNSVCSCLLTVDLAKVDWRPLLPESAPLVKDSHFGMKRRLPSLPLC